MLYPLIGVPVIGKDPLRCYMQYKYTRCLTRAGGASQLLSWNASPVAIEAALKQCVGFLFPGGPDIHPEVYGQLSQPGCGPPERRRDHFELALIQAVLAAQKPLLCIGRCMQLLNIALGGTLIQDIKFQQEYKHVDFLHRSYATHPVDLKPYSLISRLLRSDTATVNSLHHQILDTIGDRLQITADSPEGFPEALELKDYPFCLAVQWHPEYMTSHTPIQQRLFQALIDACR